MSKKITQKKKKKSSGELIESTALQKSVDLNITLQTLLLCQKIPSGTGPPWCFLRCCTSSHIFVIAALIMSRYNILKLMMTFHLLWLHFNRGSPLQCPQWPHWLLLSQSCLNNITTPWTASKIQFHPTLSKVIIVDYYWELIYRISKMTQ